MSQLLFLLLRVALLFVIGIEAERPITRGQSCIRDGPPVSIEGNCNPVAVSVSVPSLVASIDMYPGPVEDYNMGFSNTHHILIGGCPLEFRQVILTRKLDDGSEYPFVETQLFGKIILRASREKPKETVKMEVREDKITVWGNEITVTHPCRVQFRPLENERYQLFITRDGYLPSIRFKMTISKSTLDNLPDGEIPQAAVYPFILPIWGWLLLVLLLLILCSIAGGIFAFVQIRKSKSTSSPSIVVDPVEPTPVTDKAPESEIVIVEHVAPPPPPPPPSSTQNPSEEKSAPVVVPPVSPLPPAEPPPPSKVAPDKPKEPEKKKQEKKAPKKKKAATTTGTEDDPNCRGESNLVKVNHLDTQEVAGF